jgi:hypothetical protein
MSQQDVLKFNILTPRTGHLLNLSLQQQSAIMKKALVVLTSVGKYPDMEPARATGLWLGEAVHFVKKIEEAGVEVDYVSPQGG